MTNLNTPFGFQIAPNSMGPAGVLPNIVDIPDTNAVPLGVGDPISFLDAGVFSRSLATPTLVGGFVETILDEAGGSLLVLPALTAGKIGIVPARATTDLRVQMDSTVFADAASLINKTFNLIVSDANLATGKSTYVLDGSSVAIPGTNAFTVRAISLEENNDFGEGFIKVIGQFRLAVLNIA